jgi:HEAT repeat protein
MVRAAFATLGHHRAAYAVPTIAALVRESRDDGLRRDGILTLGQIGDRAAIEALLHLSADRMLRESVTIALSAADGEQIELLREKLSSSDERHRRVIVEALTRTKSAAAASVLAAALDDASPGVRLAAARALGRLDLRDARTQLATLARTDENLAVRVAAQDALLR